uniref:hypothetical protein n=1 Tax=Clostridium sp. NkU-1 TaxID=1095009 RepID=UPI000AA71442
MFNDTFSTRIPVSKIAEKLKVYGVWDVLVTDSFDEYIDTLVINTDMDEDDLFQEEFWGHRYHAMKYEVDIEV